MKPGEAGCRRSQPKLQVRLLQPGHRSPSRLPRRTPQPWQPIPPAHSHGAVTSHHWHSAPNVLFAKCFRIHAQDKSAVEKQSIVPPEHAWVSSLAREQHSFRLAHFINKVKQHIKKNSTSINGPSVSLTSSISLIKNTFIANVELKSSRSALLQWYLQTGYVGKSPTLRRDVRLCPPSASSAGRAGWKGFFSNPDLWIHQNITWARPSSEHLPREPCSHPGCSKTIVLGCGTPSNLSFQN